MKTLLVLCVGNICRSPIAEALLRRRYPGKIIRSAGLMALVGQGADPLAIEVAAEHGLDLSAHRARQVTRPMCRAADLILVMERVHQVEIERQFPLVRGKVFRLGEPGNFDIADPYGRPKAAFARAYAQVADGVAHWALRLQKI